jgi:menaquinone-dependent protoporphyrinogen IX oxidase
VKILVAYYSETGNTAQIAEAICEGLSTKGHEADLMEIADAAHAGELAPNTLNAYDLVLLGSACHDADLARPVKQILERIPVSPAFKLAGFATRFSAHHRVVGRAAGPGPLPAAVRHPLGLSSRKPSSMRRWIGRGG